MNRLFRGRRRPPRRRPISTNSQSIAESFDYISGLTDHIPNKDVGIFNPDIRNEVKFVFEDKSEFGGGGTGKKIPVEIAKGDTVSVKGLKFFSERFVVVKKRMKGFPPQDGIIGRLILDSYIVKIDFEKNTLVLYEPDKFIPELIS